ncbi:MAG: rod shape-determining protein [Erysipelotrichaceae bacterium]|uniref:rod shape-determining protein n=1 Tax=Floccifex sp. TaxID=2815810 RepID=UPI002A756132|nr:rod shape-determining protein [Floccifex sp.]MDD7282194.1 rod shape-determining protein [Erysipelotrichaceae bacterium]MDY2958423.1 rod shape-determining protein [Floccifex sp.]
MFNRWYIIDAGAYQIRIFDESKDELIQFQSIIAYKNNEVVSVASQATEYVYHRNNSIKVKYPFCEGKILSDIMPLLKYGLNIEKHIWKRPCVLICLLNRSQQEEQKWISYAKELGIYRVEFITIADLMKEHIHFYIHLGHSYTLIGLNIDGKQSFQKVIPFAGYQIDEAIVQTVLKKTKCFISMEDARMLKEACSKSLLKNKNAKLSCFGMNKYNQYEKVQVSSMDLWPCIEAVEKQIILWTKQMISTCSLELQEKILENGIYLSGGLANCFGLQPYLKYELKCPIICTNTPQYDIMNKMKERRND